MKEKDPKKRQNMKRVWERYCTAAFNYTNKLGQQQFESASKYYDRNYGKLLPDDKHAKILDIGSGAGHFLYYLKQKGYGNYWGIDISPEMVQFVKLNITERIENADVFDFLKDRKSMYDVIIGNDLIEHISKERILDLLDLIYLSLKPKGRVILKTPNMCAPFALSARYLDFTHEVGFTEHSLTAVLIIANFQHVNIFPTSQRFSSLRLMMMRLLYFIFGGVGAPKCFTSNIIGMGIKPANSR